MFDDDYYYMGGLMAERLRQSGLEVTYVTPVADVSHWSHNTMEQEKIQRRLLEIGVKIVPHNKLTAIHRGVAELARISSDRRQELPCEAVVSVTMRIANDDIYQTLLRLSGNATLAPKSITRIGDCLAPCTIAAAI